MSARAVLAKKIAVATRGDTTTTTITTTTTTLPHNPATIYTPYVPLPMSSVTTFPFIPTTTITTTTTTPAVTTTTQTPAFLGGLVPPEMGSLGVIKSPPTKDEDYKIVMVLDESGSMSSVKSGIVDSINDLIRQQKTIKDRPTLFTLIKFSDRTRTVKQNSSFDETEYISNKDYSPNGGTALYDAIGETIEAYKDEKNVLMVIITDGEENASRRYSKSDVAPKIDALKADTNKGWSFVYIGCDLATAKQGYSAGFNTTSNSCNYRTDSRGDMCGAIGAVSKGLLENRSQTMNAKAGYGIFQTHMQAGMKYSN